MMWKSWEYLCDGVREAAYTNPDNFGMYVYNDFHGYGVLSLAERQLVNFNKEYVKKDRSVHAMWSIVAMMGHWLLHGNINGVWSSVDDGERIAHMNDLIGCALLTALNLVDAAEQLKPASEFPDLALVMSLYLYWAKGQEDCGIDGDELDWRENVVAYAKKGNLDLDTVSCGKLKEELEELSDIDPIKGSTNAGRWHWPKKFKDQKKYGMELGPMKGGSSFNILEWTRKERAKFAFDKKDPLSAEDLKELKNGGILFMQ